MYHADLNEILVQGIFPDHLNQENNKRFILAKPTGCRVSENKRFWNCPRFGVPGYCLRSAHTRRLVPWTSPCN